MNKNIVFPFLFFAAVFVFWGFWSIFFAQDDFILIDYFSRNSINVDLVNVFGPPQVTHFRPLHNFFFFITGNTFGNFYSLYHLTTFVLHVLSALIIFKILSFLFKNPKIAWAGSMLYVVHPAHFVSLFWISGGAGIIGFFFLLLGTWTLLRGRKYLTAAFLICSLMASEAMFVGPVFYAFILLIQKKLKVEKMFLFLVSAIVALFVVIKFLYLTPSSTYDLYQIKFTPQIFLAFKYYVLRLLGFVEGHGRSAISFILILWIMLVLVIFKRQHAWDKFNFETLTFGAIALLGLLPFVLIPGHLSPHYLNISIFGFSCTIAYALKKLDQKYWLAVIMGFVLISFFSVRATASNNWVVQRSEVASALIAEIAKENYPSGSTIIFSNKPALSSREQYISLGEGEGVNLFFKEKNYKSCFTFLSSCE